MPQMYNANYIPGPQRYGFWHSPLGQVAANAVGGLFQMGGQQIGEWINGPSRDDQLKDLALQQQKDNEAQQVTARYQSGQYTPEQYQKYLEDSGREQGDVRIQPGMEQKMREQMLTNTAKEAGFDPATNQWNVPVSGPSGEQNVKIANPGDFNPLLSQQPGYKESFLPPQDAKVDVSKLTADQQKTAGVISQRIMAFQKTMQMFDNKDIIPTEEQMGMLHAGLRSTENDINKAVDLYNGTHTPGDNNNIKAQGGIVNLALGARELEFRTSPQFMATLTTPEAQNSNIQRIQQLQAKFQHLNTFEAKQVFGFAQGITSNNAGTYLQYAQGQKQNQIAKYKADLEHQDNVVQNQIRVASLNADIQKTMMEMSHRNFADQMEANRFNNEVVKTQLEAERWAKQLNMEDNKNAIQLFSAMNTDRNMEADRRMRGLEAILNNTTKVDIAQLKGMSKAANLFSTIKGMQGLPALYNMFSFSSNKKSKDFAEQLKGAAGDQLSQAIAVGQQGSTVENIIEQLPFLKNLIPSFENLPPSQARDLKAKSVRDYFTGTSDQLIGEILKAGGYVPLELLNLRYSLIVRNNGTIGFDNNYIRDSSDTVNVNGVAQQSQEEVMSLGTQALVRLTKGKVKSYAEFLNTELPGTGVQLKNVPEFKDPATAQKFWMQYQNLSQKVK